MTPCVRCGIPIPRAAWQPTKDAVHPCCLTSLRPDALADAVAFLETRGERIASTPTGHYARRAQQVLTDAELIEYAANERAFSAPTGREHGPALPTGAQLAVHPGIGFGAYVGPWITRSGFRVDSGMRPTRTVPLRADLPRPTRRTV